MTGHTERWIDATRLPADVVALIEALGPRDELVVRRDGRPIATISGTHATFPERPPSDDPGFEDVTVVATAMKLSASTRAALSDRLGPDYIVLDLHKAPKSAEVLLVPPVSPQLIGSLRAMFPQARVVIAEIEDEELGVSYSGPVRRLINAGADVYVPPSTIPRLAVHLDRTMTHLRELAAGTTSAPLTLEAPD
ncbi:hypothetical protein [Saccharothrix variisporea]|uniref:Uncharacterized protein n=1 Tax=Saccharothrix variisporea TaxID=543527 RepID=A0A495X5X2_9PSEU|nr:hypothetical protein [Saccharothrix variisporea]RKT66938.1 hypothetical protein DFJ66_0104 [Saccharothrix variisporea]